MFHWLTSHVSDNPATYLIALAAAGGDVLFPLIPSETIVITAAVLAAKGGLLIWLIILVVALGAFAGDNVAFWLGRGVGGRVVDRLFRGDKARGHIEWAERAIERRGRLVILAGRFIPGGRTAATFASGTLDMPYRKFVGADAIAAVAWAVYASMLGYLGGEVFQHSVWKSLAASLGVAALIGIGTDIWRRVQARRGRDVLGDPIDA